MSDFADDGRWIEYDWIEYDHIASAVVDVGGNLRLGRRRWHIWPSTRQVVFHPEGEWMTFMLHPSGKCTVSLGQCKAPRNPTRIITRG
jgi:hypothetical protein